MNEEYFFLMVIFLQIQGLIILLAANDLLLRGWIRG